MVSYVSGYSDTDDIHYCPNCGEGVAGWRSDGAGYCNDCNCIFAVVYIDDKESEVE